METQEPQDEQPVPHQTEDLIPFLQSLYPDSDVVDLVVADRIDEARVAAGRILLIRELAEVWREQNPKAGAPVRDQRSRSRRIPKGE